MIKDPKNVIILALLALIFFLVLIASASLSMARGQRAPKRVRPLIQKVVPPTVVATTTPESVPTTATSAEKAAK